MFKLRFKSFKKALPYLAFYILLVLGLGTYCSKYLDMYKDVELSEWPFESIIHIVGFVVCIFMLVVFLCVVFSGRCQKSIYKHIQNSNLPQLEREKVEKFLAEAPYIYKLQYSNDYLCGPNCVFTMFMKTKDVVRIAKCKDIHKYKMILPIFKSNYLIFVTVDGKKKIVSFRREKHVDAALEILRGICPQAVFITNL